MPIYGNCEGISGSEMWLVEPNNHLSKKKLRINVKLTTMRFLSEAHTQQMGSLVSLKAWLKSIVSAFVLDGTSSMWNNLSNE